MKIPGRFMQLPDFMSKGFFQHSLNAERLLSDVSPFTTLWHSTNECAPGLEKCGMGE